MPLFAEREIPEAAVLDFIDWMGAATTNEVRQFFITSHSIEKPLGMLYAKGVITAVGGHGTAVYWLRRPGVKGGVSANKVRDAAKKNRTPELQEKVVRWRKLSLLIMKKKFSNYDASKAPGKLGLKVKR